MPPRGNAGGPSPELPMPDADAAAHGERVRASLVRRIEAAGGSIPFDEYMEHALYAPGLGYYVAGQRRFGAGGDYVTAPELGELFARSLARQVAQVLDALGGGVVLEAGGGSGQLAAQVLAALAAAGRPPEEYWLLEVSADLRRRQRETIEAAAPALAQRVRWLDGLPESGFRGVVIANEVLDAMPVVVFRVTGEGVRELHVRVAEGNRLELAEMPPREHVDRVLRERVDIASLASGYTSELGLRAEAWVRALGERLGAGAVLIVDYGFPRHEFFHEQRAGGTLMCHYRHRSHANPLWLPGLQDVTAHVEFTAIAEAALASGLKVRGFTTQAAFLLALGILENAGGADDLARFATSREIQLLTQPHEMGELFKVMALARGIDVPLQGFGLQDHRARL